MCDLYIVNDSYQLATVQLIHRLTQPKAWTQPGRTRSTAGSSMSRATLAMHGFLASRVRAPIGSEHGDAGRQPYLNRPTKDSFSRGRIEGLRTRTLLLTGYIRSWAYSVHKGRGAVSGLRVLRGLRAWHQSWCCRPRGQCTWEVMR